MMSFEKSVHGSFVVSVIHDDKPLRETGESGQRTVRLPFDSEYKLRIKSKSTVRAKVNVSIDGTDILPPKKSFLLAPGDTLDLERFCLDSLDNGKKFRFISVEHGAVSGEVQDPTSKDNGLVRVTIHEEVPVVRHFVTTKICEDMSRLPGIPISTKSARIGQQTNSGKRYRMSGSGGSGAGQSSDVGATTAFNCSVPTPSSCMDFMTFERECSGSQLSRQTANLGATAEGGLSHQQFQETNVSFKISPIAIVFDIWLRGDVLTPKPEVCKKRYLIVFSDRFPLGFEVSAAGKPMSKVKKVVIDGGMQLSIHGKGFDLATYDYEVRYE